MTPQKLIETWKDADLSERSAYQQHFLGLCELLDQPKPASVDKTGAWYTFEKGVSKDTGGQGFADVWMKGHFGWEYKGKRKDLKAAYRQLQQYREALANPPLLLVCDLDRFAEPKNLAKLRAEFTDPGQLRPGRIGLAKL